MSRVSARPARRRAARPGAGGRGSVPGPGSRAGRPADLGAAIAVAALVLVIAGTALAVDPRAESSFDAPKRLIALLGTGAAAAALALLPSRDPHLGGAWRRMSRAQRVALSLALLAAAAAAAAALHSPRPALSLDALRALLLFSLLLPLGASRALEPRRSRALIWAFLAAAGANAIVSLLQRAGVYQPFEVALISGRADTGAFVGSDGLLALVLSLAVVASAGVALSAPSGRLRLAAGSAALLCAAGIAVNSSLTAVSAVAAGLAVLVALLLPGRQAVAIALAALALGTGLALVPVTQRSREARDALRAGEWNRLLSYRLGPWTAAIEMARARPATGWGPGTFAAEYVPHLTQAELHFRRRFANPFLAGSYAEAHSDYLQAAAETGIPATAFALAALAVVGAGLLRLGRGDPGAPTRGEAVIVLALLTAGAVAALTWFPMQRPVLAAPLLLAAGRAWRLTGPGEPGNAA